MKKNGLMNIDGMIELDEMDDDTLAKKAVGDIVELTKTHIAFNRIDATDDKGYARKFMAGQDVVRCWYQYRASNAISKLRKLKLPQEFLRYPFGREYSQIEAWVIEVDQKIEEIDDNDYLAQMGIRGGL